MATFRQWSNPRGSPIMNPMQAIQGLVGWWKVHVSSPTPDFTARAAGDGVKIAGAAAASAATFAAAISDSLQGTASFGLPLDKLAHAQGAALLTVAGTAFVGLPPWLSATSTFVLSTVGKELVWDMALGKGYPDPKDALANASGCLAGYALVKALEARRTP